MWRSRPSPISASTRKPASRRGLRRSFTYARGCSRIFMLIPSRRAITSPSTTARECPTRKSGRDRRSGQSLLTAPETPIRFGSGELSMYRDIATMDQGPGYLNGILSLHPEYYASGFAILRGRAARRALFPSFSRRGIAGVARCEVSQLSRRPALHAKLLEFYSNSGESDAVIQGGREFLANFPNASERTAVALLMADAYRAQRRHRERVRHLRFRPAGTGVAKRKTCRSDPRQVPPRPLMAT